MADKSGVKVSFFGVTVCTCMAIVLVDKVIQAFSKIKKSFKEVVKSESK